MPEDPNEYIETERCYLGSTQPWDISLFIIGAPMFTIKLVTYPYSYLVIRILGVAFASLATITKHIH